MHNELFIADNVLGVTGGRNLGDAYFGNGEKDDFVDLDVLAAGPIVQHMSRSFYRYWNDRHAYPVQSAVPRKELEASRERVRDRAATESVRGWDQQPMDLKQARFVWAPALLVVDQPGKISVNPPGPDARAGSPGVDARRPGALGAAGSAIADGETGVDGLLQLIGQAKRELLVIAPYFVPGADIKKAFAPAKARGVRIRVLTNSLASNDAPVAHGGYARHREELPALGVELYELRSEAAGIGSALGSSSGSNVGGESRSTLYSKVLGEGRPAAGDRLDEPRSALAAAQHRADAADPQHRTLGQCDRSDRACAARQCLARGTRQRRSGLARRRAAAWPTRAASRMRACRSSCCSSCSVGWRRTSSCSCYRLAQAGRALRRNWAQASR